MLQGFHEGLVAVNGFKLKRIVGIEVRHLNMSAKTDNFIADLLLKTSHNGYGNDHYGKAQRYSGHCHANERLRELVVAAAVDSAGNK